MDEARAIRIPIALTNALARESLSDEQLVVAVRQARSIAQSQNRSEQAVPPKSDRAGG